MSTFPSTISIISTPAPTDKLNSPSHSGIESSQNSAISHLENFIGTLSSIQGTLMYDIRGPNSDGGGHVQSANKGGTGQTAFTKGDILVAQSSSVVSKLAIGSNNQVLTADSNQQSGVKWAGVANAVDMQNQTYSYARGSVMSASVYGVNLSQNVSILSDGLGMVIKFPSANTTSVLALTVGAQGPSSLTALLKRSGLANIEVGQIEASMIGVVEFDSVSSVFQLINPQKLFFPPTTGLSAGTAYFASTDGFIFGDCNDNNSTPKWEIFSDTNSNPGTLIMKFDQETSGAENRPFCCPIKKGNYYKLVVTNCTVARYSFMGF